MKKCNGYRILSEEECKEYTESSKKEDVKITDAQNAVVKKRDSNILVSAAAGSGKTWVLVKRIIDRLISERIDITSFLIVTFTNAAANEMRTRIADEINDELKKAIEAGDEDLVSFLSRQAALVNIADISTTDAFCNTLVKEHFMELGIDPSYRIGDDT
jgi:ATP-dependent helicase/nuclease subunit A